MTRRDDHVKGASVIGGYRMEPDLAQRLTAYARENFVDDQGYADVARAARFLLRTQLGILDADDTGPLPERSRGLRLDTYLYESIEQYEAQQNMSFLNAARHLIRLGLGYDEGESRRRETAFADLAAGKRGLMESA